MITANHIYISKHYIAFDRTARRCTVQTSDNKLQLLAKICIITVYHRISLCINVYHCLFRGTVDPKLVFIQPYI